MSKDGKTPTMFVTSITAGQLRSLFRKLTFTSFEENKIPSGLQLMKGPVMELVVKEGLNFKLAEKEIDKKIVEIKKLFVGNKISDYIVSPSFIVHPDGKEFFILQVLVAAPIIEIHQTIPQNPQKPSSGEGRIII